MDIFISQGGQVVNLDNFKPIYSNGWGQRGGMVSFGIVRVYSF